MYETLEKLGEGAHGSVKKCRKKTAKHNDKFFAVKIIRNDDEEI